MQPIRPARPLSRGTSPNLRSNSPRGVSFGGNGNKGSNSPSKAGGGSAAAAPTSSRSYSPRLRSAFLPSSTANKANVVTHVFPATARDSYLLQKKMQEQRQQPGGGSRTASPAARTASPYAAAGGPLLGRSTSARAINNGGSPAKKNNSRANSPDPRSHPIVVPFRDITRQPTSTTIDGRLLYLLKDYSNTVLPSQDHKVQNIASRLRRSKILQKEEMTALETCHQRNANFMGTIERILGEAVEKQVDMRRSVIHQAYEIWRVCADANTFIGTLLDTAQSAIGAGKYNKANIAQYNGGGGQQQQQQQQQQLMMSSSAAHSMRSGSARHTSPSMRGGGGGALMDRSMSQQQQRAATPAAFAQIARPNAPSRQQLEPFRSSAGNAYVQRTASPSSHHHLRPVPQVAESLSRDAPSHGMNDFSQNMTLPPQQNQHQHPQSLFMDPETAARQYRLGSHHGGSSRGRSQGGGGGQHDGPIGVEDAKEAQTMFEKLFGPEEGRTRFLHWLSELPQSTIQQLHRHLQQQQ